MPLKWFEYNINISIILEQLLVLHVKLSWLISAFKQIKLLFRGETKAVALWNICITTRPHKTSTYISTILWHVNKCDNTFNTICLFPWWSEFVIIIPLKKNRHNFVAIRYKNIHFNTILTLFNANTVKNKIQ